MVQAADLLAAEAAERHRRVVLIVDEAHLLEPAQLEELRLLTNSEMDSASPFAGILVGQPTLNRQLRMGIFAALDQRIATRFSIKAMDLGESAAYLRHHLKLAGERSLSSPMTPSHAFTVSLTDFPGRSTTPPPRRSSPLPQTTRISSTTRARRRPPPSSPGTDRAHGRGERTAMVIEACRAVLTERCRLMCKQRGRQQVTSFAEGSGQVAGSEHLNRLPCRGGRPPVPAGRLGRGGGSA